MKTFLKIARFTLLLVFGTALTIALTSLFGMTSAPADRAHLQSLTTTPEPELFVSTPTPTPIPLTEIGSTDGIMVMTVFLVAIVVLGILLKLPRKIKTQA